MNTMKKIMFILSVLLITVSCTAQSEKSTSNVTVLNKDEFKNQVMGKNVQLVDVRTANEYAGGKIDDAINVDYFGANFKNEMEKLDKNQALYIYCQSGRRSGEASKILTEMGFTKIFDLKGGYGSW
jgi:rhodanese-related sulfurtransferase